MSSCYGIGIESECTCGANQYGIWHYQEYYNYCPLCGCEGGLGLYYMGDGDTEIHCYICGADYCSYDGLDKSGSYRAQLTPYTPEPQKTKPQKDPVKAKKSKLEVYSEIIDKSGLM